MDGGEEEEDGMGKYTLCTSVACLVRGSGARRPGSAAAAAATVRESGQAGHELRLMEALVRGRV